MKTQSGQKIDRREVHGIDRIGSDEILAGLRGVPERFAEVNERLQSLLQNYATEYQSNSLSDDKAKKLLDQWIVLDKHEANHRKTYAAKVLKVLPAKKAARYLQIENEARVLVKYDLAKTVPLVE